MRLICPNCGAQYDVDGSMIPDAGRDVQCSNCGHGWFQHPEEKAGAAADDASAAVSEAAPERDAEPQAAPPDNPVQAPADPPKKPRLDPTVTDVLRAEAEREAAQRRAEAPSSIESQPDLGLEESDTPEPSQTNAAKARMARLRGLDDAAEADAQAAASRSDLLPDVEEINSTLRGKSQAPSPDPMPELGGIDVPRQGGFRFGFYLIVLLAVIAVVLYAFAPQIAAAVPAAEPALTAYVNAVNGIRGQINGVIESVVARIRDLASSIGG